MSMETQTGMERELIWLWDAGFGLKEDINNAFHQLV